MTYMVLQESNNMLSMKKLTFAAEDWQMPRTPFCKRYSYSYRHM